MKLTPSALLQKSSVWLRVSVPGAVATGSGRVLKGKWGLCHSKEPLDPVATAPGTDTFDFCSKAIGYATNSSDLRIAAEAGWQPQIVGRVRLGPNFDRRTFASAEVRPIGCWIVFGVGASFAMPALTTGDGESDVGTT